MDKTLTIRDLPLGERPRERLKFLGARALSLRELLAIILGRGIRGAPVLKNSEDLLRRFPSLSELSECSLEDLQRLNGLGFAKACQLTACFELGRRLAFELMANKQSDQQFQALISPPQVAHTARKEIKNFHQEQCIVLSFDIRHRLIACDELSLGILNANLVHPREVFGLAIKRHAAAIILCHNHPSGDIEPSTDDLDVTDRLVTSGKIMGIELLDHVIINQSEYWSFKERNLL
jgi:DNA repair protein RadC